MNCSSGNSTCTNAGTHQHGAKWYYYPHWLTLQTPQIQYRLREDPNGGDDVGS